MSSMIAKSATTADAVATTFRVPINKWLFISFPYDVKMKNVKVLEDGALWTIRKYSGENRARGEGDTWITLGNTDVLEAHKGYILQCSYTSDYVNFEFPAEDNANKNTIFSTTDIVVPLTEYAAEFANNRSWNLVGNPFGAYFYIQELDYNAPVTVRTNYTYQNGGYQAFTPWDDEYVFHPNEAFFVQAPIATSSMTFLHSGAQHDMMAPGIDKAQAPARARVAATDRSVFNIILSNGEASDRTRLVLNEKASAAYELNWDAEKMMSGGAPLQVYMLEGGLKMAINERPAKATVYPLGYAAAQKGKATIALSVKNANQTVYLDDALTGISFNLSEGNYEFDTEAGTNDKRFAVRITGEGTTAIDDINAGKAEVIAGEGILTVNAAHADIYTASGILINSVKGNTTLNIAPGLYVVKAGNISKKVLVK